MKIKEKDVNTQTSEETIIERDETAEETQARLDRATAITTAQAEAEAKTTARAEILNRLGLTAEEAAILLS
jgi:hypothetical protein